MSDPRGYLVKLQVTVMLESVNPKLAFEDAVRDVTAALTSEGFFPELLGVEVLGITPTPQNANPPQKSVGPKGLPERLTTNVREGTSVPIKIMEVL